MSSPKQSPTTIRLSLGLICIGIALFFLVGGLGGYTASRLISAPVTVLQTGDRTVVPVSQQVTISPSKNTESIASAQGKSVLVLVKQTSKAIVPLGTGIILTNDGVIMSTKAISEPSISALGEDGTLSPITLIGHDALSDITFFRIADQILPPVTLAQSSPAVGSEIVNIFRDYHTMHIGAVKYTVSTIIAPDTENAPGIQRVGLLSGSASSVTPGTALFNDEGRLVGAMLEKEAPTMVLVSDITDALSRLSANTLAEDPFATTGIGITWRLEKDISGTLAMMAVISHIDPKSPSFTAGIKPGDVITAINGNAITWDSIVSKALEKTPLSISVLRQGEERTITLP